MASERPPSDDRPERLLVAARLQTGLEAGVETEPGADDAPRYVFVRWEDWPHPAMLSIALPGVSEDLPHAVQTLMGRLNLTVSANGALKTAEQRIPVRMAHPRFGGSELGWLRPLAVSVTGEPQPDAMLEGVELLALDQALEALPTEVERTVLRAADALFD